MAEVGLRQHASDKKLVEPLVHELGRGTERDRQAVAQHWSPDTDVESPSGSNVSYFDPRRTINIPGTKTSIGLHGFAQFQIIHDTDGQDNVFMGKYDRDGGDDGVYPMSLADLPYVPSYIDPSGEIVVPVKYVHKISAFRFREGMARVIVDDKWGFIDLGGEEVIATPTDSEALTDTPSAGPGPWFYEVVAREGCSGEPVLP